jgi:AraC-like DNA-binding protein
MANNTHEVLQKINAHLATHPNASLQAVAEKLGMASQEIERCLNEIEGVSFQQLREGSRLAEAFRQLNANRSLVNQLWETKHTPMRIVIPEATIKYRIHNFWPYRCAFSNPCPVIDLNSSGLGFLADLSQKPGKRVSLHLTLPGMKELLELNGHIAYSVATGISGYRYRVGIRFLPFAKRRGCNSLEALAILNRLEKDSIDLQA